MGGCDCACGCGLLSLVLFSCSCGATRMVTLTLQSKANKDINHFNFFSSREPKPMIECNLED